MYLQMKTDVHDAVLSVIRDFLAAGRPAQLTLRTEGQLHRVEIQEVEEPMALEPE